MNLAYYANYVTIVEEGSLTAASRKLRIAQPALSNQIKALETAYGARLFYRGARKLELTDAAKALIIQRGYDPLYGARPLKRVLQGSVETLIARTILRGDLAAGSTITVDAENGELVCR